MKTIIYQLVFLTFFTNAMCFAQELESNENNKIKTQFLFNTEAANHNYDLAKIIRKGNSQNEYIVFDYLERTDKGAAGLRLYELVKNLKADSLINNLLNSKVITKQHILFQIRFKLGSEKKSRWLFKLKPKLERIYSANYLIFTATVYTEKGPRSLYFGLSDKSNGPFISPQFSHITEFGSEPENAIDESDLKTAIVMLTKEVKKVEAEKAEVEKAHTTLLKIKEIYQPAYQKFEIKAWPNENERLAIEKKYQELLLIKQEIQTSQNQIEQIKELNVKSYQQVRHLDLTVMNNRTYVEKRLKTLLLIKD